MTVSQTRTKLIGRLADRKARMREGQILVEGVRAVEEALGAGLDIRFGVVAPGVGRTDRGERLLTALEEARADLVHTTDRALTGLANTESPQGILLVCSEPDPWSPVKTYRSETGILF